MSELKPCPFCGSKDVTVIIDGGKYKYVHCDKCGADGPPDLGESGAVEQWNTRPEVDAICNWTPRKDKLGYVTWETTCLETVQDDDLGDLGEFPYCPCCGKKARWGIVPRNPHD